MDYGSLSLEAMAFSDLYPFLISILIGALVGTERERDLLEKKKRGVAGLRTFILITSSAPSPPPWRQITAAPSSSSPSPASP